MIKEVTPLGTIDYAYDVIGRRTSMTVAGQPTVSYSYDSNSRLTGINTTINSVASGFSLAYDAIGRRTSLTLPNGAKSNYTYDNGSRLLNLEHLNPANAVLESLTYSYDATGNRISMNRPAVTLPLPNGASNINYNEANQMLSFQPEAQSAKNMTYDENGNMTSVTNGCGTTTYNWDVRNRLVGISGFKPDCSALTASFKYDALGRRIEKTINGTTTQYVYDGLDIIQEKNQSGTVTVNYIRTLSIDEPLARVKADGSVRYYQQDVLGSAVALTDESGAVRTTYSYDPFGGVTVSGEASDNPFQYTGREKDGTGLYYYRARYYSPELQRFVSEDPIRLRGGINFFRYVGNSPINYIDPLGLAKCILEGCRYTQSVRKNYSEWQFVFSRVEGPEPGMIFPIYYLECWWKRRVTMTIGMAETCNYRCYDDCGGSYTYTTTKIYEGYTRTYTESTGTGKSFFIWDALALVLPDGYCQQYLRP